MTNRYNTLDVTVNLDQSTLSKQSPKKFSNTIDFGQKSQLSSIGQNDQRVNKFRELYYKNEKLRKQLKLLNVKLNERLQRVKLMPSKKKKAMSVDLNVPKPSKALQRQLQNAYSQVAMYKKQIATLKVKQQSQSTYQKYKNLQNQISYKDIQINQIQAELKSIKNIKKIQDKTLIEDVENQDLKEKLAQYQREFKQGQEKLKDIAKKARKRQQEYKKQQAYQVALEKKLRKGNNQEDNQVEEDKFVQSTNGIIKNNGSINQPPPTQQQFLQIKQQILKYKTDNQNLQKRLDKDKKTIRDLKKNRSQFEQKYKQMDADIKGLNMKAQSYRRLIKDMEKKNLAEKQIQTGYNQTAFKLHSSGGVESMMKLDQIDIDSQDDVDQSGINQSQYPKKTPFQMSQGLSTIKNQRQWNGKPRKITIGFMDVNDTIHKLTGSLKSIKVYLDESHIICGLNLTYIQTNQTKQSGIIGSRSNTQHKFQLQPNDKISKIQATMTQQGYLTQLIFITENGNTQKLGNQVGIDKFSSKIDKSQFITGFYCGLRKLGQDTRITEIGFWLNRSNKEIM